MRPKLRQLARDQGIDPSARRELRDAVTDAVRLGACNIFLDELLDALHQDERAVLLQVAVSSLPVPTDDLAQTLADTGLTRERVAHAARSLTHLSLLVMGVTTSALERYNL